MKTTGIFRKVNYIIKVLLYLFRRPVHPTRDRFSYQKDLINHRFVPGELILDLGSGGDPFPYATILADRFLAPSRHRDSAFQANNRPVIVCDIHSLPFKQQQFDYVTCCHVLEHVENPLIACAEIQRVGKAGFIECPSIVKDGLFAWARGMHQWHVLSIHNRLLFFEYSDRQLDGIRSSAWFDTIFGPAYHPLQTAFDRNQDFFNTMFEWNGYFSATVYHQNGDVLQLKPSTQVSE